MQRYCTMPIRGGFSIILLSCVLMDCSPQVSAPPPKASPLPESVKPQSGSETTQPIEKPSKLPETQEDLAQPSPPTIVLQPADDESPWEGEKLFVAPTSNACCRPSPSVNDVLLESLFEKYLTSWKDCDPHLTLGLDEALEKGQFAPRVEGIISGKFSIRESSSQRVALVTYNVCHSARAQWGAAGLYVLRDDDQVETQIRVEANQLILAQDIDADGLLEVAVGYGYTGAGGYGRSVDVFTFKGGTPVKLANLGEVQNNTCLMDANSEAKERVIYVVPGSPPRFRAQAR